VSNKAVYLSSK